jgi:hypothetical protein
MALVKFGGGIVQMAGSIAGTTFARNSSGNYARSRTKPVNPVSSLQVARRSTMAYWTEYWHETLSPVNRTGWATYANAVNMKNRLGETIKISGFNHFVRVNMFRATIGQSACPNAPTVLSLPDVDPAFAISASVATQLISVAFNDTLPWGDIVASAMGVFMGRPQMATRNFFRGPWQYGGSIAGNAVSPQTFTAPMALVLGQRVWCYARIATGPTDSRLSSTFTNDCIVAA